MKVFIFMNQHWEYRTVAKGSWILQEMQYVLAIAVLCNADKIKF